MKRHMKVLTDYSADAIKNFNNKDILTNYLNDLCQYTQTHREDHSFTESVYEAYITQYNTILKRVEQL